MKCLKVEKDKDIILTVEHKFLCFTKIVKYKSDGVIVGQYHRWIKLPDMIMVSGGFEFQLDTWLRNA